MFNVFIGYDPRESVAAYVCMHSIQRRTRVPVFFTLLSLPTLPMWRERDPRQSTDFAFSRFLCPYLSGYKGHSLFLDCDILVRCDIKEIFDYADNHAVHVVQHDYEPKHGSKFLGSQQTIYPRKNWSSVILFNNAACRVLTEDYVNSATGLSLHQFRWLDDHQIGNLPKEYNHLVDEYPPNSDAKIVHYTRGGPYFRDYSDCEFSKEWFDEFNDMNKVDD